MFRFNRQNIFVQFDDAAIADQFIQIEFVNFARAFDKMIRRVNVRRGVNTETNLRNICRVAVFNRIDSFYFARGSPS